MWRMFISVRMLSPASRAILRLHCFCTLARAVLCSSIVRSRPFDDLHCSFEVLIRHCLNRTIDSNRTEPTIRHSGGVRVFEPIEPNVPGGGRASTSGVGRVGGW